MIRRIRSATASSPSRALSRSPVPTERLPRIFSRASRSCLAPSSLVRIARILSETTGFSSASSVSSSAAAGLAGAGGLSRFLGRLLGGFPGRFLGTRQVRSQTQRPHEDGRERRDPRALPAQALTHLVPFRPYGQRPPGLAKPVGFAGLVPPAGVVSIRGPFRRAMGRKGAPGDVPGARAPDRAAVSAAILCV